MKMIKNNSAVKADTTSDLWVKMNKLTVGECFFQIRNGANIKQGVADGGFPITRIETIANDRFNRDRMGYAGITDADKYQSYILEDGDLLMSHINSVQYLGRTVLYHKQENEKIIHGMNLLAMKANRDILNPAYAQYYFRSIPFRAQIRQITKKSVNQASFTVSDLKKIPIQVPSLLEQCNAVETLDRVNKLLELHQQQLQKLDELVKARFVEMFGDPVCNTFNWPKIELGKRCEITTGNTPSRAESENYGTFIEWIKSDNINTPSTFLTVAQEYLSEIGFQKCRFVESGSLLMTCIAGSLNCIGNVAITDRRVAFNQQINAITPKYDNVLYLYWLIILSKPIIHRTINMALKGILSKSQLSAIEFPFPPLSLQNQFASFVTQVDKSKSAVQKSLDEAQLLFDSLMQQYFG